MKIGELERRIELMERDERKRYILIGGLEIGWKNKREVERFLVRIRARVNIRKIKVSEGGDKGKSSLWKVE